MDSYTLIRQYSCGNYADDTDSVVLSVSSVVHLAAAKTVDLNGNEEKTKFTQVIKRPITSFKIEIGWYNV
jgi:hypothetical protein